MFGPKGAANAPRGRDGHRGGNVMAPSANDVTFVGLDVHLSSVTAAAMIGGTGEVVRAKLPGDIGSALGWVDALPGPKRVTYEAGPCGFGLARALQAAGVDVMVCAPGLVPRAHATRSRPTSATPCC